MERFVYLSWIPVALYVATSIYVQQYDGWGAWAAAPMFLIPLAASLGFGLFGVGRMLLARKEGGVPLRLGLATVLAWIPMLIVVADNLLG